MNRAEELAAVYERKTLGFWVYLMTDCLLFASLFATFAVLRVGTAGGPSGADIFDLPFVLVETLILLTSSFTIGLAILGAKSGHKKQALGLLGLTLLLGVSFLAMELWEFQHLIGEGLGWQRSAFLSSYFVLVGVHGIHIAVGILWLIVVGARLWKRDFRQTDTRRLALLGMFWHFLDVVWIFIFSFVYLIGGMA